MSSKFNIYRRRAGDLYNPSTWEAEAGGSHVQSQPGLHRNSVSKNIFIREIFEAFPLSSSTRLGCPLSYQVVQNLGVEYICLVYMKKGQHAEKEQRIKKSYIKFIVGHWFELNFCTRLNRQNQNGIIHAEDHFQIKTQLFI
jgi:hypothetical protein